MFYKEQENDNSAILDDGNVKETINIIKQFIDKDIEVNIKTEEELVDFIDNPEKYVDDDQLVKEIKDLKELIVLMGDFYYAGN